MRNLLVLTLSFLMVLVNAAPVYGQSLAGDCRDTQAIPLVHGQPVTLEYQTDQTVTLAGDTEGKADLQGQSVVAIEFSSGQGIGYGVESEKLAPQNVNAMLSEGSNTIRLTAVNPEDSAWLIVETPCPAVALAPTATRVLIPTPTPLTVAVVQPPTGTISITDDSATMASDDGNTVTTALMQRTGRVLLASALLGLILLFATGNWQSWQVSLRRLEEVKRQGLRLRAWWRMLAAYLLAWWKRQT